MDVCHCARPAQRDGLLLGGSELLNKRGGGGPAIGSASHARADRGDCHAGGYVMGYYNIIQSPASQKDAFVGSPTRCWRVLFATQGPVVANKFIPALPPPSPPFTRSVVAAQTHHRPNQQTCSCVRGEEHATVARSGCRRSVVSLPDPPDTPNCSHWHQSIHSVTGQRATGVAGAKTAKVGLL